MQLDVHPKGTALEYGEAPYSFVRVEGASALAALAELRRSWQDATPVIWGSPEQAARLFDRFDEDDAAADIKESLAQARARSSRELMDERAAAIRQSLAAWLAKRGEAPPEEDDVEEPPRAGRWPSGITPHQAPLSLFDLHTGRPHPEVLIGLIPTARSWEIPAYHRFGSWNDCPSPAIHAAFAREWSEKYGADLIVNTPDVIEFEVASPIASREEAIAVAEQQFRYANDIVYQGTRSIEGLAASLLGARYWFFWWD